MLEEELRREKIVLEEARERVLKPNFKVTAILAGSCAKGDFNKWSDVDIIHSRRRQRWPAKEVKKGKQSSEYEIMIWTLSEFRAMLKKRNPLALEALDSDSETTTT